MNRSVVAVSVVSLMFAVSALARDAAVAKTDKPVAEKPRPPKPEQPAHLTGTVMDAGLEALVLEEATKAKVIEALKAWKAQRAEDDAKLETRKKDLLLKMSGEKDKAAHAELEKQYDALKGPTQAEVYKSARAGLKDILSAEQLAKVDQAARDAMIATATKMFTTQVANWSRKGVELTADEKAKVDAVGLTIKAEVDKLELNTSTRGLVTSLIAEAKATLPADKAAKITPKPTTQREHRDHGRGHQ